MVHEIDPTPSKAALLKGWDSKKKNVTNPRVKKIANESKPRHDHNPKSNRGKTFIERKSGF